MKLKRNFQVYTCRVEAFYNEKIQQQSRSDISPLEDLLKEHSRDFYSTRWSKEMIENQLAEQMGKIEIKVVSKCSQNNGLKKSEKVKR